MPLDGRDDPQPPPGLSEAALSRVAALQAEIQALLAVQELAALLDPQATRGRWSVAGELADRLRAFEGAAWRRIRAGHREPRGTLETMLSAIAASDLPRTQRRLFDLLG